MAVSLSLLLCGRVRAAVVRRGFATRGVAGPGPIGREPDPDSDWEPEERELQEVASALKQQQRAIRFQKIRRQMEATGAPPRTLTREAMEQIRYLHKEFAEAWSVPRLAEGFDVSTDVIRRVLKSKFVPTLEQKLKQDQQVFKKAGLAHTLPQIQTSGTTTEPLATDPSASGLLLAEGSKDSPRGQSHSPIQEVTESGTYRTNTPRRQKGRKGGILSMGGAKGNSAAGTATLSQQSKLQKYSRDGERTSGPDTTRLPREKLEELETGEAREQNFSSKVIQRGQEFFDSNGNFLYRI